MTSHDLPCRLPGAVAIVLAVMLMLLPVRVQAGPVSEDRLRREIIAPYSLGAATDIDGVWTLLNGSGLQEGYVIQSEPLAPLPGFSGSVINLLIMVDLDGSFIDVKLLHHNEPIFVSGLGEAPFRGFLQQYRGLSLNSPITVGTAYGENSGGSLVYLDGVSKATASVRIAHQSVLAAAREVAKQKLKGMAAQKAIVTVIPDGGEAWSWQQLKHQGLARHVTVTFGEVRQQFVDSLWQDDDPYPERPDEDLYIDLWIVDVTAPAVARAVMKPRMLEDWQRLQKIAPNDQTILLIENAEHGLVSEDFVRNTSPGWITASQDEFPLLLRDADLLIDLKSSVPHGTAMVVRLDRHQGFNPVREWSLGLLALREHGIFRPLPGYAKFVWNLQADQRFFHVEQASIPLPPVQSALLQRLPDVLVLAVFLVAVLLVMTFHMRFVRMRYWKAIRLAMLGMTLGFIGWWGQGQLSIVTPLGAMVAVSEGKSLEFLLYDPFSLLLWVVVIISFFLWGRALFCGWLCPFGVLQEGVALLGQKLGIQQLRVIPFWDAALRYLKYLLLAGLIAVGILAPAQLDTAAEIEPFKTAISVFFVREGFYVLYAVFCLVVSALVFKGYCRYACPLGALMAIGGLLRLNRWITRRAECGSPCQLCKVKCQYGAIAANGAVVYRECFGCLDCVDIYQDQAQCVPRILEAKKKKSLLGGYTRQTPSKTAGAS